MDYFYEHESELFTFYRVPKVLFTEEPFKNINCEAKLLYGLLLDKMGLSRKSGWFDQQGRAFVYYGINRIMEDLGCAHSKAEKMANEDARFVLPNACTTKMICTMNARSLLNFFSHRCCNRAQWEIRELATQMLQEVKAVAPHLFEKAGPPCLRGACPEGKMSCGQMAQVRERFKML